VLWLVFQPIKFNICVLHVAEVKSHSLQFKCSASKGRKYFKQRVIKYLFLSFYAIYLLISHLRHFYDQNKRAFIKTTIQSFLAWSFLFSFTIIIFFVILWHSINFQTCSVKGYNPNKDDKDISFIWDNIILSKNRK